ncbi:hypothetical protein ELH91_31970 [Rhizobium leguminosarum]|uniref:hypothetical protein n=1 Tax=Rhizobium leguminosarum TaxID=384 RepID=UPI00103108F4|nr:hypothetical protein [Rhizobium leguminosarum]TAY05482.1 hypothetical protein ELH91_31970 [Rhizobium leguminosarum]
MCYLANLRGVSTFVILLLIINPDYTSAKSIVEYCEPYSTAVDQSIPSSIPFMQYGLDVTLDNAGRKIVTVTGDEIVLSFKELGNIIRSPASVDETISKIVVQAKTIKVAGPLAIKEGSFELSAERIIFETGSTLALLPNKDSRINLVAKQLVLASSGYRHFDVRSRSGLPEKQDNLQGIDNILTVVAEQVFEGTALIPETEVPSKLARRFTRFPLLDPVKKIDVTVGSAGREKWVNIIKADPKWLAYSLAVIRSTFELAPFAKTGRDEFLKQAQSLESLTLEVGTAAQALEAQSILGALERGTDLSGNGPAFVGGEPLSMLLNEIKGYRPSGERLENLKFYLAALNSSADDAPLPQPVLNTRVAKLSNEMAAAVLAFKALNDELVRTNTELESARSLIEVKKGAYHVREKQLLDHIEDLKRSKQDRAQVVSLLATAASIATTAYTGSPQTGAAVGGVITAIGATSDGKPVITSLGAGIEFAEAVQKPLEEVTSSLSSFNASRSNYEQFISSFRVDNITILQEIEVPKPGSDKGEKIKITRNEAIKGLTQDAGKLKDGIQGLVGVYDKFRPSNKPVDAKIEDDADLKRLAGEIAETLEKTKELIKSVESMQRTVDEQALALVVQGEKLSELKSLPITNEQRRKTLMSMAIEGSREELGRFVQTVEKVQRVSLVEFRSPLPVDQASLRNVYVSNRLDGDFDPAKTLENKAIGEQYVSLLDKRMQDVQLLSLTVLNASNRQFKSYLDLRGRAPSISYPTEEILNQGRSPAAEKTFLVELNKLLKEQFEALPEPSRLAKLQMRQLELPFDLRSKLDNRYPARLLQLALTDVLTSPSVTGGDLVFRLEVERVGNLRKATSGDPSIDPKVAGGAAKPSDYCFSVDLRSKDTKPLDYFLPFEFTIGQVKAKAALQRTSAQSFWYLTSLDAPPSAGRTMLVTYPPAEARMYLRVRLDPNTSWKSAPTIRGLTVTAEVFQ